MAVVGCHKKGLVTNRYLFSFFRLLFKLALCFHIVRTPPLATTYLAIGFPLFPPLGLYSATRLCEQFLFKKSPFSKV